MYSTTGNVFQRSLRSHNGIVDQDFVQGNQYHADSVTGKLESTRFYNNGKPRSKLHLQHVQMKLPSSFQAVPKKMYRKTPAPEMFKKQVKPTTATLKNPLLRQRRTKKKRIS